MTLPQQKKAKQTLSLKDQALLIEQIQYCCKVMRELDTKIRMKEIGLMILEFANKIFGQKEFVNQKKRHWLYSIEQCYMQKNILKHTIDRIEYKLGKQPYKKVYKDTLSYKVAEMVQKQKEESMVI